MSAAQSTSSPGTAPPGTAVIDPSQIAVPVQFDLGVVPTTLDVLASLQAGFVFELESDPAIPVTVRVHGALLARGELVCVDDRIGVRLVEVFDHASRPA